MEMATESERMGRVQGRQTALLLLLAAMTSIPTPIAWAQTSSSSPPGTVIAASRTYEFSIPPQSLAGAIAAFSRTTGLDVIGDGGIGRDVKSPGVSGVMLAAQALSQLLAGTGLSYRYTNASTIALLRGGGRSEVIDAPAGAIALDPINVQGANPNSVLGNLPPPYAGGQVATGGQLGILGNRSVMDTPFNQTSYTQKAVQDQQARVLNDVLANDPSVISFMPRGSDFSQTYIRGFISQESDNYSDYSLNGLFGLVPGGMPSLGMIERVEVLKGPSAFLNGMPPYGATGGTINLVTKRAGDEPLTELTTSYISRAQFGSHVDVGRRFGESNEFGARFNGTYRNGETAIDPQKNEQGAAALNLDYRGQHVRLSADIGYLNGGTDAASVPISMGALTTVPAAPDASKSLAPFWRHYNTKSTFGMAQGEIDLTENVTAYFAGGVQRFSSEGTSNIPSLLDPAGNFQFRGRIQRSFTDAEAGQAGIRAGFATGPIDHKLNFNISRVQQETGFANGAGVDQISNLYNPIFGPRPSLADPGNPAKADEVHLTSYGVADTLSILNERIQLTLGLRRQRVEAASFDTMTGAETSSYDAQAWTPAYTLVVKPWHNVSLYGNYIEGLQQGTTVGPDYANWGEIFAPYRSKQYEAGIKVDWGTVTTTLSAFQIARPNIIVVPGAPLSTLTLSGEQVNRGIELNVFGELTPGLRVLGGATFIDARLTRTPGGINDGKRAAGVPDARYVIGGEFDAPFLRGLTFTGRVTHSEEVLVDSSIDTLTLPSWNRFDIGARYTFDSPWNSKPITVRFNVENIFNKSYWASSYFGYVALSEPRTFILSTSFKF